MKDKMKNIHILPTDKPSRLYLGNNGNFVFGMSQTAIQSRNDDFTNQKIYITSDEEIKEGDWCMSLCDDEYYEEIYQCKKINLVNKEDKKIILTTDQDLIKDGVQSIDDEFLEWFVKNPSCEEVEVKPLLSNNGRAFYGYKIIIPKKEPKKYKVMIVGDGLPKQETLEEVLGSSMCQFSVIENKLAILYRNQVKIYDAITKEQQSYSEEEVIYLLNSLQNHYSIHNEIIYVDKWFEQFKKK